MKRECETCIKRKTPYCPTSIDCMATDDMPYYQNRIMLLEENQELKKQLEEYQLQNIDLRTDIMIQKKAFPNKEIKDKTFYNLFDMPTYEDLLNQQKEFIEFLEEKIICYENYQNTNLGEYERNLYFDLYNDILEKYKEIIGGKE